MLDEAKNLVEICLMLLLLLLAHWGQIVYFKLLLFLTDMLKRAPNQAALKSYYWSFVFFYTCLMKLCYDTLIEIRGHSTKVIIEKSRGEVSLLEQETIENVS